MLAIEKIRLFSMVAWVERQEKISDRAKVDVFQVLGHTMMIV